MESITIFLAQLWGPAMLAVGLGIFISKEHYIRVYKRLETEPFAGLVFGMSAIAAAVAHIQVHNVWETLPEIIISFLGWALLLKGAIFVIKPGFANSWADRFSAAKLIPFAGAATIILGVYLSWIGFM